MVSSTFFAPATSANLAAGFDILGMALSKIGDKVTAYKTNKSNIEIISIKGDQGQLPLDPTQNTASVAVAALLKYVGYSGGIGLEIEKKMPLCSGLGSSAASAAAAVAAVNHLLQLELTAKELVPFAMQGEAVASGSAHADNVAPSLMGGIVLIRSYHPLDVIQLSVPENLYYSIVHPNLSINTKEAREQVPQNIPVKHATQQMGNIATFVAGLYSNNLNLISNGLEDWIAEPARAKSIPGFSLVKQAALDAGALGAGLSGSGPSMFAFSDALSTAEDCACQMSDIFNNQNITSNLYFGKVNTRGAFLVTEKPDTEDLISGDLA